MAGDACMAVGGMHGSGGGMHGSGGGMRGSGGVHGRGCVWQWGACMVGVCVAGGACVANEVHAWWGWGHVR